MSTVSVSSIQSKKQKAKSKKQKLCFFRMKNPFWENKPIQLVGHSWFIYIYIYIYIYSGNTNSKMLESKHKLNAHTTSRGQEDKTKKFCFRALAWYIEVCIRFSLYHLSPILGFPSEFGAHLFIYLFILTFKPSFSLLVRSWSITSSHSAERFERNIN